MEFLEGKTLLQAINEGAPMDPLRASIILRQICGSLEEAHSQSVVHRDLKPSNIVLIQHGGAPDFIKVLDFGLVKLIKEDAEELTRSGLFLGSPNYMSPEQVRGDDIDGRSDIYALGVILYMCLTGISPFKRESSVQVLMAQLEEHAKAFDEAVPGHSIPQSFEWIVQRCLEKKRENRFATAAELSRALRVAEAEARGELTIPLTMVLEAGYLVLEDEVAACLSAAFWNPMTQRSTGSAPVIPPPDDSVRPRDPDGPTFPSQRKGDQGRSVTEAKPKSATQSWATVAILAAVALILAFIIARNLRTPPQSAVSAPASSAGQESSAAAPTPGSLDGDQETAKETEGNEDAGSLGEGGSGEESTPAETSKSAPATSPSQPSMPANQPKSGPKENTDKSKSKMGKDLRDPWQ